MQTPNLVSIFSNTFTYLSFYGRVEVSAYVQSDIYPPADPMSIDGDNGFHLCLDRQPLSLIVGGNHESN